MLGFARNRTTPVLTKGGTYDTWVADAFAAPSACWDGTRWVMTVSAWDNTRGKWASLFFTSSDLVTWSYVSGSIRAPQGTDYILGNGSIAWFLSKYWFSYSHYLAVPITVSLDHSTDLLSWTNVADPIASTGADSGLVINPWNSKLEVWHTNVSSRDIYMQDSSNGTAWTDQGLQLTSPTFNGGPSQFGEAHAFYPADGSRWVVADIKSSGGASRMRALFKSANRDTTYTSDGSCLGNDPLLAWEVSQVFDGAIVGAFDTGDGLGSKLRMLYAGGDNVSTTDNTNSSIGLAWMDAPSPPGSGGARRLEIRIGQTAMIRGF